MYLKNMQIKQNIQGSILGSLNQHLAASMTDSDMFF